MILTNEEIWKCLPPEEDTMEFARAIEAAILKKIGEPVAFHYTVDCCGVDEDMFGHPAGYYPINATPLYKLPEMSND